MTVTDYSSQLRVGNDSAQGFGFYGYKANPLDPDNPWIMTKYSNVDATEEWNTVGNYGGTTEPSYNNWPVVLASKK